MTHNLKTWPEYFQEVLAGKKKFELRKNDRYFLVGDTLHLLEWDNEKKIYTGNRLRASVSSVLIGGNFGLEEGYCIMSISNIEPL